MTAVIVLALIVVAALLAGVDQARNAGQSLLAWAVLALAIALIIPRI